MQKYICDLFRKPVFILSNLMKRISIMYAVFSKTVTFQHYRISNVTQVLLIISQRILDIQMSLIMMISKAALIVTLVILNPKYVLYLMPYCE